MPSGRTEVSRSSGRSGPSQGRTIDPSITSSRTQNGSSANPGGHRGGPDPSRQAGNDRTSHEGGTPPNPMKVQSGPKITRISEP